MDTSLTLHAGEAEPSALTQEFNFIGMGLLGAALVGIPGGQLAAIGLAGMAAAPLRAYLYSSLEPWGQMILSKFGGPQGLLNKGYLYAVREQDELNTIIARYPGTLFEQGSWELVYTYSHKSPLYTMVLDMWLKLVGSSAQVMRGVTGASNSFNVERSTAVSSSIHDTVELIQIQVHQLLTDVKNAKQLSTKDDRRQSLVTAMYDVYAMQTCLAANEKAMCDPNDWKQRAEWDLRESVNFLHAEAEMVYQDLWQHEPSLDVVSVDDSKELTASSANALVLNSIAAFKQQTSTNFLDVVDKDTWQTFTAAQNWAAFSEIIVSYASDKKYESVMDRLMSSRALDLPQSVYRSSPGDIVRDIFTQSAGYQEGQADLLRCDQCIRLLVQNVSINKTSMESFYELYPLIPDPSKMSSKVETLQFIEDVSGVALADTPNSLQRLIDQEWIDFQLLVKVATETLPSMKSNLQGIDIASINQFPGRRHGPSLQDQLDVLMEDAADVEGHKARTQQFLRDFWVDYGLSLETVTRLCLALVGIVFTLRTVDAFIWSAFGIELKLLVRLVWISRILLVFGKDALTVAKSGIKQLFPTPTNPVLLSFLQALDNPNKDTMLALYQTTLNLFCASVQQSQQLAVQASQLMPEEKVSINAAFSKLFTVLKGISGSTTSTIFKRINQLASVSQLSIGASQPQSLDDFPSQEELEKNALLFLLVAS
jgi:hypothetical protein